MHVFTSSYLVQIYTSVYRLYRIHTQAIKAAQLIIVSVGSQDVENLLNVIKDDLDPKKHILVSSKDQVKLLGCNNF